MTILRFLAISLFIIASVVSVAASVDAAPLTPNEDATTPIGEAGANQTTAPTETGSFISWLITGVIGFAGLLAVLQIVLAGFMWSTARDSADTVTRAKEKIQHAVGGLILALASYLILNTINPRLVDLRLILPVLYPPVTTGAPIVTPEAGQEYEHRQRLSNAGISINKDACSQEIMDRTWTTPPPCTNLAGLPSSTIDKIIALQQACGVAGCVLVTGGTEPGHRTHGVGRPVVDFSKTTFLNQHIVNNASTVLVPSASCGIRSAPRYILSDGGTYVDESNHWHVCYPL